MDTVIAIVCDGDRRVSSAGIGLASQMIKVADLQQMFEAAKKAVIVVIDTFIPPLKEMAEKLKELVEQMDLVISLNEIAPHERPIWYQKMVRNNYRKILHLPLRRRIRCRWRQRESRRALEGLSPNTITIDEVALEDE